MNVVNFHSKQCERICEQLDAYLSNELLVETTGEVLKHLESCADCSGELEVRTHVREALQRAVAKQLPPAHLNEAVHQRLRDVQRGFFRGSRSTTWVVALAGLACALFAGVVVQRQFRVRSGRNLIASILTLGVSDHLECAIQGHHYPDVAYPPETLRHRLGPEYAGLLSVVEAKLPGFEMLEAHVCHVHGSPRHYVHFIARGKGTILSVILTKREGQSLPEGQSLAAETSDGIQIYQSHLDGMQAAGFESKRYFGFVVSDLGKTETMQIASTLAPAVRNALDGPQAQQLSWLLGVDTHAWASDSLR